MEGTANIFSAVNTFSAGGAPIVANSTSSQNGKIVMQDNGTVRGYLGADGTNAFTTINAAGTTVIAAVSNTGNFTVTGVVAATGLNLGNGNYIQSKDTSGTLRPMLWNAADNYTNIGNVGGNAVRFLNQASSVAILYCDNSGNLTVTGTVTASSDERLKENWSDLPTDFLARLAVVKHGTYDRIDTKEHEIGVSAQDLQLLMPDAVRADTDGMLSVAYGNAALVAVIALTKEVAALRALIGVPK